MKETSFIEQNKKKWQRFEELYESTSNDPEELSDLYMDITDDLSYSQTFYKHRTVRVYLNQLAQKVYTGVHKQKGESLKKFLTIWQVSLPLEIYRSRKNLLFALIAFLVYVAIGVLTTHIDPDFPRIVMGDGYVDMTLENIQKGNPLAVYEDTDQLNMFIRIATNNLKVAFATFLVGFAFTIGTHLLMFYNGVMLGAFQYFFHTKGLLVTSFLGIWIHGAFEISAIVLAAGAGITAGNGLLFPGSYTRLQSLQLSTKRGLKIMLSLMPIIVIAGFLESYVTHNYQVLPDWSKWTLIAFSFGIILFLYVFYPIYIARKYPDQVEKEEVGNFAIRGRLDFTKIRSVSEVVSDSIRLYRQAFPKFVPVLLLLVLPVIALVVGLQDINHYNDQQTQYWYDWAAQLEFMMGYGFTNFQDIIVLFSWTFIFALIFTAVLWSVTSYESIFSWKDFFKYVKRKYPGIWLSNLFLCAIVLILPWYFLLALIFVIPFFYLNAVAMGLDDDSFGTRFKRGFKYGKQHYGKSLLILLTLLLIVTLSLQPIAFVLSLHLEINDEPIIRDLLDIVADFVKRVTQLATDDYMIWSNIARQVVYILFMLFILPLLIITMVLSYYSEKEKTEAGGLKKAFEKFGKRSHSQETEVDYE